MPTKFALAAAVAFAASNAFAQDVPEPLPAPLAGATEVASEAPLAIAVPDFPVAQGVSDGPALGRLISNVVAADLRSTGLFTPLGPEGIGYYPMPEATAPAFAKWRETGAQRIVTGFVQSRPDGRITVGCYLFDVTSARELVRQGYVVPVTEWRRAAHRCADTVYTRLSGESAFLDSRIVYVAETGPKTNRTKRVAIMDADGSNHRYLTDGKATVLTPRLSADGRQLVYVSYVGRIPRVFVLDVASGRERLLVPGRAITFAPRFSPDGREILFSMAQNGNTDIYVMNAYGGIPRRLTATPGIDTAASYSPDGSRIVFESDRSGTQQLYVMNADGSAQRRISFGGGRYASPVWSPTGDRIAFTRLSGPLQIGVMDVSGANLKIVAEGWHDEGPSWSPNGQYVLFHRVTPGNGQTVLHSVSIRGGQARRLTTPQDGSDASWSAPQSGTR